MEVAVRREESFSEAIPAVAQFVDLVRAEGVCVRDRYQLHSRRREGIESRQLPAACGQGQRKGLLAVSEEIPAGQNVRGVEIVIDLRDQAGQPIE